LISQYCHSTYFGRLLEYYRLDDKKKLPLHPKYGMVTNINLFCNLKTFLVVNHIPQSNRYFFTSKTHTKKELSPKNSSFSSLISSVQSLRNQPSTINQKICPRHIACFTGCCKSNHISNFSWRSYTT